MGEHEKSSRRRRVWMWIGLSVAGAMVLLFSVQYTHPLFPTEAETECTVTSPSDPGVSTRRNREFFATLGTDCGPFTAGDRVTCTADPSRKTILATGTTFDFIVRGPRIPVISNPTVISAQVSATQPPSRESPTRTFDDEELNERLETLRAPFEPEALRAWDYEQPAYDPLCDSFRLVMTSQGVQTMGIERSKEVLRVPEGVTPRDPLLPCAGTCEGLSRYD